ncbi:phage tail protein [Vibrio diabolicus]|uniref:phage tail-collar fiber domain-containing protein n=1 Tax=Vibrio diabolicus TaxID=50719 RepID=UPI00232AEB17|nr:phage tail protein [Vibrio diabolicus]
MALVITEAGRAASVRAGDLGVEFKIAHISIGTEGYTPTAAQTELRAEIIRQPVTRGRIIKTGHLHFEADFVGKGEFEGKEIGYHLDDENHTLFAVDSDDGKVMTLKRANAIVTEVFDLNLSASRIDNITVEVATTPMASEDTPGIAEVSTDEEILAGQDDERIVTPKKLRKAVAPNPISQQEDEILLSKSNVFFITGERTLPSSDDIAGLSVRVDELVDLEAGDVILKAPENEMIKVGQRAANKVRIVEKSKDFEFIRTHEGWRA